MLNILFERFHGISSGNNSAVEVQMRKCCQNGEKKRKEEAAWTSAHLVEMA